MTLSKHNMATLPTVWDQAAVFEDISRMDSSQLEKYVRLAFTGQEDLEFLPLQFWYEKNFAVDGGGELERKAPSQPGNFFGFLYSKIPEMKSGDYTRPDGSMINPDEAYQNRLEQVLTRIMNESIDNSEKLDTRQANMLAYFSVQATEHILRDELHLGGFGFIEGFKQPEGTEQWYQVPLSELPEIKRNPLFQLAAKVMKDPKYSHIDFNYTLFRRT